MANWRNGIFDSREFLRRRLIGARDVIESENRLMLADALTLEILRNWKVGKIDFPLIKRYPVGLVIGQL